MVTDVLRSAYDGISRTAIWIAGAVWGYIAPTIPFGAICLLAIALDCFTAYRLSKRVKAAHPNANDGKFKSSYARRMFTTLTVIYACIVLGYLIDVVIYPFVSLALANWIAGGFCAVQLLSVLENESSCNGSSWARALQKILVNKAARHFDINPSELCPEDDEAEDADKDK